MRIASMCLCAMCTNLYNDSCIVDICRMLYLCGCAQHSVCAAAFGLRLSLFLSRRVHACVRVFVYMVAFICVKCTECMRAYECGNKQDSRHAKRSERDKPIGREGASKLENREWVQGVRKSECVRTQLTWFASRICIQCTDLQCDVYEYDWCLYVNQFRAHFDFSGNKVIWADIP